VESVLLFSAVLVNLAGVMFESGRFDTGLYDDQKRFLTWVVVVIIVVSVLYFVVVLVSEVYTMINSGMKSKKAVAKKGSARKHVSSLNSLTALENSMATPAKPGAATQSGASSSGSPDGASPASQAVMNPMFLRQMQVCLRCGGFRSLPRTASISSRALFVLGCGDKPPRVCFPRFVSPQSKERAEAIDNEGVDRLGDTERKVALMTLLASSTAPKSHSAWTVIQEEFIRMQSREQELLSALVASKRANFSSQPSRRALSSPRDTLSKADASNVSEPEHVSVNPMTEALAHSRVGRADGASGRDDSSAPSASPTLGYSGVGALSYAASSAATSRRRAAGATTVPVARRRQFGSALPEPTSPIASPLTQSGLSSPMSSPYLEPLSDSGLGVIPLEKSDV
jgi:hypothetical protein